MTNNGNKLNVFRDKLFWSLISNLVTIVAIGFWAGNISSEIKHLKQYIDIKAEDRFTGTDGRLLEERIRNNTNLIRKLETDINTDIQEIKQSILRIEKKLD